MPFRRYRFRRTARGAGRRRPYARRRPMRSGVSNFISKAAWAARQVWKLKGLVNSEKYKLDLVQSNQNVTDTPSAIHITAVAQGDGDSQRTGNSIYCRSVNGKFFLYRSTSGDQVQTVRLSLVMDSQQVGDTTPGYTDVYEAATPVSHLNSNTVGRFKVLWSNTYCLDVVKGLSIPIEMNVPMRHHARFNGAASTDIQRGGLYLMMVSTQGTSNYPILNGEIRLSYHDN